MSQTNFLKLLFDPADRTCFAQNPYDTSLSVIEPDSHFYMGPYFSINAMQHTRTDQNVTKHRTFLLEFDSLPLAQQRPLVNKSGLPVSAIVFSGNKSYHFFVCLETPVSAAEYADIAKRLHMLLPDADKSTKNPSRLARLADVQRPDTQVTQALIFLGSRVSNETLLNFLPPLPVAAPKEPKTSTSRFQRMALIEARRNPDMVMRELGINGRNNFFFWLGQRLQEDNQDYNFRVTYLEDVYSNLNDQSGFSWREAKAAARID